MSARGGKAATQGSPPTTGMVNVLKALELRIPFEANKLLPQGYALSLAFAEPHAILIEESVAYASSVDATTRECSANTTSSQPDLPTGSTLMKRRLLQTMGCNLVTIRDREWEELEGNPEEEAKRAWLAKLDAFALGEARAAVAAPAAAVAPTPVALGATCAAGDAAACDACSREQEAKRAWLAKQVEDLQGQVEQLQDRN